VNFVNERPPFDLGKIHLTVTEVDDDVSHFKDSIWEGGTPVWIVRALLGMDSPI